MQKRLHQASETCKYLLGSSPWCDSGVKVAEEDQLDDKWRPRGLYDSRCDEKGRLKLNEDLRRYFVEAGHTRLFITSFDGRTALIYPIPVWEEAEQLLESPGPNAKQGKALWLKAQKYGSNVEIDNQGRVLLPTRLRKEMEVENAAVHMAFFRGHLEVYSTKEFEALDQAASENTDEMLDTFVNLGLR